MSEEKFFVKVLENIGAKSPSCFGEPGTILKVENNKIYYENTSIFDFKSEVKTVAKCNHFFSKIWYDDYETRFKRVYNFLDLQKLIFELPDYILGKKFKITDFNGGKVISMNNAKYFDFSNNPNSEYIYCRKIKLYDFITVTLTDVDGCLVYAFGEPLFEEVEPEEQRLLGEEIKELMREINEKRQKLKKLEEQYGGMRRR